MRIFLSIVFFSILTSCTSTNEVELRIAVASNMQYAIEDLTEAFEEEHGINCEFVLGSSGKLCTQIMTGGDYDLFISADQSYPEQLYNYDLVEGEIIDYAQGRLVLWTNRSDIEPSLEILQSDKIETIACPNPELAPYGTAAWDVLAKTQIDGVTNKFINAQNISQTNQYIEMRNCDIGFTSLSSVISDELKDKGKWVEIDSRHYGPIIQSCVVLKNENKERQEKAELFVEFLTSEKGKSILNQNGYGTF